MKCYIGINNLISNILRFQPHKMFISILMLRLGAILSGKLSEAVAGQQQIRRSQQLQEADASVLLFQCLLQEAAMQK